MTGLTPAAPLLNGDLPPIDCRLNDPDPRSDCCVVCDAVDDDSADDRDAAWFGKWMEMEGAAASTDLRGFNGEFDTGNAADDDDDDDATGAGIAVVVADDEGNDDDDDDDGGAPKALYASALRSVEGEPAG